MDFFEVLKKRASVRAFLQKDIEEEKLQKVLEAANSAPSAGNLQAYKIFVVRDSAKKEAIADAALGQGFIAEAPAVLVFFADSKRSAARYGERGKNLYCTQDATIACSYAQLAAVDLGLSSVWVGAFDDGAVREALNAESSLRAVAILSLGYAAEKPFKTSRRNLKDTTSIL